MNLARDKSGIEKIKKRALLNLERTAEIVRPIIEDVRQNGDDAVRRYTRKFDSINLNGIEVTKAEIASAMRSISAKQKKAIKQAIKNISDYHKAQMPREWMKTFSNGRRLGQLVRPVGRVGCYIPGGRYPLTSTVMMTVVPAKVAGVKEIIICSPPEIKAEIIAAAKLSGADRIFKAGGAQAIAAMAYGTETIPKVDKIVGPGNVFVTAAKKIVYGAADIDFIAGPSEIMIIADDSASPRLIAADMLAQAEHDIYASAVLVTTSREIAKKTSEQLEKQLDRLETRKTAELSLKDYGAIIIAKSMNEAVKIANDFAPEHLEIIARDENILRKIENVGAVFIGPYSCESAGDYASGPSHVLPTGGFAMARAGLNVMDFIKMPSVQVLSKEGLRKIKDSIISLAEGEGLKAHAESVRKRFEND